jgi:hypothetical protein
VTAVVSLVARSRVPALRHADDVAVASNSVGGAEKALRVEAGWGAQKRKHIARESVEGKCGRR